uniref:Arylsulfatase n=1 Tax=Schlesneria paludicola TaxID=360056 RepID=A0A7C2K126_9PLAN
MTFGPRLLALALAWMSIDQATAAPPNFIIFNIDDLGYADIGPYGSDNATPNLDRLAREGRKLTSHYAAPVCSPSRAALMTGCYPKRALPIPHVLFPAAEVGLNPEEVTIAEVLKTRGYATGCIGKWHLGDQPEFLPTRQGFDSYFGIPYSNDMGPAVDGSKSNPDKPLPTPQDVSAKAAKVKNTGGDETGLKGASQPPLPLLENETVIARVRVEEQFDLTRRYTDRAVQFLKEHQGGPFFLYLPHTAVHFPLYPSADFRGKSPNGLIGDWVQEVDASVGRVLDTVRELKLDRNTLVLFTSDNGGALANGSQNTPLRGSKGQTFEGGLRVCTIAWWPGQIPAGTSTAAITSMMDVLPTFARLADAELPKNRKLDGVDLWPVLTGDPATPPRTEFFYFRGFTLDAVRSGPWKLHISLADGAPGKKKAEPRLQLFHLDEDIGETTNAADAHPDVVRRLQTLAAAMNDDLGTTGLGPGCRPLGRVPNPQPLLGHDGTVRTGFVGDRSKFP